MQLTVNLGRPDNWQQHDSSNIHPQDMSASDQDPTGRLRQRSAPVRNCRTTIVTRVLHQGEEVPKGTSLQWLVNELLSKNALHEGGKPSREVYGDEITEGQSSSSTLTLHVECKGSGERGQVVQASEIAYARDRTPRSPSSASSQPLSAVARHYANMYFDAYWKRTPDGAPCRYTDADCWHPGVQAAVISTVIQLRQQGTYVDSAPILAFMQDKAVRQYGEVKNGHKFKRPPSKKCVARYRAIAAAWLQTYSQHQTEGTLPADMHAILCSGDAVLGPFWKTDPGLNQLLRSQSVQLSSAVIPSLEPLPVDVNPFLAGQGQAFKEPFRCPQELELLSSPEASNELDEPWLASMVAELLTPGGAVPSSTSCPQGACAALPDLDPKSIHEMMAGHESFILQQTRRSNKRKRCFSAGE